ncbi:hypothetical protein HYG87_04725 [Methanobacterium alkalithermotolerans]|uniref:tRNA_anti-like n=1 Tax=Methanobacterium alkalithermotolerans TaxID=2731220 RepID=A0A8T8K5K5_9EURY|nr:hypothetical protein [Methanobacterium alkalithermotolerans]QUH23122.1 hypothetical protein HYG87_04725 [Methanobacterium alkalithermotolerans]RJS48379.1 MAG: hypothetical protein CIT03_08510 [Methanobacterium sp.]
MEQENKILLPILILALLGLGLQSTGLTDWGIMLDESFNFNSDDIISGSGGGLLDIFNFYLPVIPSEEVPEYKASAITLNQSIIDYESWEKVKVTGEITNKRINYDGTVDIILKVSEIPGYHYIYLSYSQDMPFQIGDNITAYGQFSGRCDDEDLSPEKMIPLVRTVYIEKIDN